MARTRIKKPNDDGAPLIERVQHDDAPAAPPPPAKRRVVVDVNTAPEEVGAIPNPARNLVVELSPNCIVERVDENNWEAKIARLVENKEGRTVRRWYGLGYFASPGFASRKLLQFATIDELGPGAKTIAEFVAKMESMLAPFDTRALLAERARALMAAADRIGERGAAETLRKMARELGGGR